MTAERKPQRVNALEAALAEAIDYAVRELRVVIDCNTRHGDLTTADKEARPYIDEANALLERWNLALYGVAHPAGVCRFCRCTENSACELPDGEPCAWYTPEVCTNPACVRALKSLKKPARAK